MLIKLNTITTCSSVSKFITIHTCRWYVSQFQLFQNGQNLVYKGGHIGKRSIEYARDAIQRAIFRGEAILGE